MRNAPEAGLKSFLAGLIVVVGLAIFMFTERVPLSDPLGQTLWFSSLAIGLTLGTLSRLRETSQKLTRLSLTLIPFLAVIIAVLLAFPDYAYSEVFDRMFHNGVGTVVLLSTFLSGYVLPVATVIVRNISAEAPTVLVRGKCVCPSCGDRVRGHWRACPNCGEQIVRRNREIPRTCPSCRETVEPKWVKCPFCGISLVAARGQRRKTCHNCGKAVEPGWRKCPFCAVSLRIRPIDGGVP